MILDFLLIFVFLLCVLLGSKKGFSQMLISCGVFLFSIILIAGIYNYLGELFFSSEYGSLALEKVTQSIDEKVFDIDSQLSSNVPFLNGIFTKSFQNAGDFAVPLAQKILKTLISIPLIILSFVILKLLVYIVRKIVLKTSSLPVISTIDSLLGGICGAIFGILSVGIMYYILAHIQFLPSLKYIREQFDSSLLVLFLNDIF